MQATCGSWKSVRSWPAEVPDRVRGASGRFLVPKHSQVDVSFDVKSHQRFAPFTPVSDTPRGLCSKKVVLAVAADKQTSSSPALLSPLPPTMLERGTVVVVGGGPAGLVCAIQMANRGFRVEVFEGRGDPASGPKFEDAIRAFSMLVSTRCLAAIRATGACPDFMAPGKQSMRSVFVNGKTSPMFKMPENDTGLQAYLTDRYTIARDLVAEARRLHPDRIRFHFNHKLASVDFGTRTATFTAPAGGEGSAEQAVNVSYDLLVGCDGANSTVRRLLQEVVPELKTQMLYDASSMEYKVVQGLPATLPEAGWELVPGITQHQPLEYLYRLSKRGAPNMSLRIQPDRTLRGLLVFCPTYEAKELKRLLTTAYPQVPEAFVDAVVSKASTESGTPASNFGRIIKVSQFHGPRCVLLGDAAHAITASLGQGCNFAMDTVHAFGQVVDAQGYDLDKIPEAFTKARRPDAHAMQHLELTAAANDKPGFNPLFKAYAIVMWLSTMLLGSLAHKLMPRTFPLPIIALTGIVTPGISFRRVVVSAWLQTAVVLGSLVGLARLALSLVR